MPQLPLFWVAVVGSGNPVFVEWMMMLPAGWVTGTQIGVGAQLRILGNGVVPLQAATAFAGLMGEMSLQP